MIAMSKYEMVRYLKDYADLQYLVMEYPNVKIKYLFSKKMLSEGRIQDAIIEYYDRMRRVYLNYIYMKKFSFLEDFYLNRDNYINNNELDDIIPENTYSTNMGNISKKKLLQLIRNTFNHNNSDDVDRFKMSVNARKFEIELLNGPVKIKFDTDALTHAYNNMVKHGKNSFNESFDIPNDFDINSDNLYEELGKIKFVHYYFNQPLSDSTIKQFEEYKNFKGLTNEELIERSKLFHVLSSAISEPVKYELNDEQKQKLVYHIKIYKDNYKDLLNQDINNVMFYFLTKVIPVPLFKDWMIDNQTILCGFFMDDVDDSYYNKMEKLRLLLKGVNSFDMNNVNEKAIYESLHDMMPADNLNLYRDSVDAEMIVGIPIITYIDSVVTHCCKDDIINIDGKNYNTEKIRNSFVHGRWFITADRCIMMYDADPRNVNDYNLEFVGKINIGAFERWADQYVAANKERIDTVKGTYKQ